MATGLADKPEIVALNKADALTPEELKRADRAAQARRQEDAAGGLGGDRRRRAGGAARAAQGDRWGAARASGQARRCTRGSRDPAESVAASAMGARMPCAPVRQPSSDPEACRAGVPTGGEG